MKPGDWLLILYILLSVIIGVAGYAAGYHDGLLRGRERSPR